MVKSLFEPEGTRNLNNEESSLIILSDSLILEIIRRTSLDVSKKIDFFKWCSFRHDYKHSVATYSQVDNILDKLNPDVYNSVLIALVRSNPLNMALFTLFKLLDSVTDDDVSFINFVACNELLVVLRKTGMKSEFRNVFYKSREKIKKFSVDVWGYNVCIHSFGTWGELETSLTLFKEMKENSDSLAPDLCTYNSLIQSLCFNGRGYCKCYRMNNATKIFSGVQYNGFRPDTIVYNSMLDGFLKSRKVMEACQLFEKMVDDGLMASFFTYNILIDGLFKNRRGQAAYALFADLKKKGQFVDGIT
ncbi:hypothetical protein R6Q59_034189 [Mikania micrantha]